MTPFQRAKLTSSSSGGVVVRRWSNPATWGGTLPVNGDTVTWPNNGEFLLYDLDAAHAPNLAYFTNEGSFGHDPAVATKFVAAGITNEMDAHWWAGASGAPILDVTIELNGAKFGSSQVFAMVAGVPTITDNDNGGMSRGFMNMGNLHWYGSSPDSYRTKLKNGSAAAAGTNIIQVDDARGWKVGGTIILGITSYYGNSSPERFTITKINGSVSGIGGYNSTLELSANLSKSRYTNIQYPVDMSGGSLSLTVGAFTTGVGGMKAHANVPSIIDERAMVIYMNRGIKLQGANDSDWTTFNFGAHLMTMYPGTMVQDGVWFIRCGQDGFLGRYPTHWHNWSYNIFTGAFRGAATGQAVRNCSFDSPANRAVTMHGVCGATVDRCVSYNGSGQQFFTEDGSEEDCFITNNAVIGTKQPLVIFKRFDIPSNQLVGVSGYWLGNPKNTFTGNWSNGCNGPGFWLAFASKLFGSTQLAKRANGQAIVPICTGPVDLGVSAGNESTCNHTVGMLIGAAQHIDPYSGTDNDGEKGSVLGAQRWIPQPLDAPIDYAAIEAGDTGTSTIPLLKNFSLLHNAVGGYHNTTTTPHYQAWTVAGNLQGGFDGTTKDFGNVGLSDQHLIWGKTLNYDLTNDPIPYADGIWMNLQWGFATYHTSLNFADCSCGGFPYQEISSSPDNQFGITDGKAKRGGLINANDLYLIAIECGFPRFRNLRIASDTYPMPRNDAFQTYPYNLATIYDPNGIAGDPTKPFMIYDIPFLTTGASAIACSPVNLNSKRSAGPFYGVQSITNDINYSDGASHGPGTEYYPGTHGHLITRLDSSMATVATWKTIDSRLAAPFSTGNGTQPTYGMSYTVSGGGTPGVVVGLEITSGSMGAGNAVGRVMGTNSFASGQTVTFSNGATLITTGPSTQIFPGLGVFKHFSALKNTRYRVDYQDRLIGVNGKPVVWDQSLLSLMYSGDRFTMGRPWGAADVHIWINPGANGATPTGYTPLHINTSVGSIAAVEADSTGQSYYLDTTNGYVWFSPVGQNFGQGSQGPDSDAVLRHEMGCFIMRASNHPSSPP